MEENLTDIEVDDYRQFFRLTGGLSVRLAYPGGDRRPSYVTLEELYQIFKVRMLAEMAPAPSSTQQGEGK